MQHDPSGKFIPERMRRVRSTIKLFTQPCKPRGPRYGTHKISSRLYNCTSSYGIILAGIMAPFATRFPDSATLYS